MLTAKVRPTGGPPRLEAHQPAAMRRPAATPVAGQGHLRCCGSPGALAIQIAPAIASTRMTSHGETPSIVARVGGAPPIVMAGAWSDARTGAREPSRAAVAPRAKPSRMIHAPTAPSPVRYQVLPEQPPPSIIPAPKMRPPVTFESQ